MSDLSWSVSEVLESMVPVFDVTEKLFASTRIWVVFTVVDFLILVGKQVHKVGVVPVLDITEEFFTCSRVWIILTIVDLLVLVSEQVHELSMVPVLHITNKLLTGT